MVDVLEVSLVPVFFTNKNHNLSAEQSAVESSVYVTAAPAASFGPFVWSPDAPTKSVASSLAPNNSSDVVVQSTLGA